MSQQVNMRLEDDEIVTLKRLGAGSTIAGVRALLTAHKEQKAEGRREGAVVPQITNLNFKYNELAAGLATLKGQINDLTAEVTALKSKAAPPPTRRRII